MNKSQRIYLNTGNTGNDNQDKYIKIKLEQDVETLEFMSLSLGTADVYQNFNADYGILVGRVLANGGIGIPNARISIFIPLSDEDAQDKDIYSVYPYTTPRDKNNEGKRYNLLPRVAQKDPQTGIITPKQPFGSFPIKEEIVGNLPFLNAYKKYYKYTALTNNAGDYMIFGVPIGTQTIHLSCDITDIGEYSMTPAAMVTNLGYSPNLFTDNNSKIKPSNDLNDLPNIETQEITVDIKPFWGDTEIFEIGITRQDFRIRSVLKNTFVLFGSVFTDGDNSMWGENKFGAAKRISEMSRARTNGNATVGIYSKRTGEVTEKIYYYPPNVSDYDIDNGIADPTTDMLILDPNEYSVYKKNGDFAFIISCNRNKIVTDEQGNQIPISYNSVEGIFNKFRGFITLEISDKTIPMNFSGEIGNNSTVKPFRFKLKFPQHAVRNNSFRTPPSTGSDYTENDEWRAQHKIFEGGKYYSFSRFHSTIYNDNVSDDNQFDNNDNLNDGFFQNDTINKICDMDPFWTPGIITTETYSDYENELYQMVGNGNDEHNHCSFGANWLNLSIYLPQLGYLTEGYSKVCYVRSSDEFAKQKHDDDNNNYYYKDNSQAIGAGDFNTRWMARSDLNWTDIIEIPETDIILMADIDKGFINFDLSASLTGSEYRDGNYTPVGWCAPCPINGGKMGGNPTQSPDGEIYFFKGFDTSDCVAFIKTLGLV